MLTSARKKKSLKSIFMNHKGKVADKWESYLDIYEDELAKYRCTKFPVLEIGVQNCGSLEVWAKYFEESELILGVDIVEELKNVCFADPRIKTYIIDANNLSRNFSNQYGHPIIIIDDASHQSIDIISTFLKMFPLLRDGGLYVVEDMCCSYWKEFNVNAKLSSVGFFKSLVDIINYEHWEDRVALDQKLKVLGEENFQNLLDIMNSIRSIKFVNSMCFVEKLDANSSGQLKSRLVVGDESVLGFKAENGQKVGELERTKRDFTFDDADLF